MAIHKLQAYTTQNNDKSVPVMLIIAEWDQDTALYMAQELFPKIVNSPEKNRTKRMQEVQTFLDDKKSFV